MNSAVYFNCACGNWLKHWEKFGLKKAQSCAAVNCSGTDLSGVHVQKANSNDEHWYVIPLCAEHSVSAEELEVSEAFKLVPASVELTCERW